jgi:TolA-binding protein
MLQEFPRGVGRRRDESLFWLGESLYAAGRKREAAAAYGQLLRDHPNSSVRVSSLYGRGVALEELGQYADAGQVYDEFLKRCGEHELAAEVRMRKAETVLQAGLAAGEAQRSEEARLRFQEAERQFAEAAAVAGFPSADHAIFRQALCVLKQDRPVESAQLYAALAVRFPESVYCDESVMNAARCYYRGRKYADAATWFQRGSTLGGEAAAEAAHWLCRMHLQTGQPEKALKLAAQAAGEAAGGSYLVQLKIDQADALRELAGRRAESIELYRGIAREHAQDALAPQALYHAALGSLEEHRYAEGLRDAAAFLATHPQHALAAEVKSVAAECRLQLREYGAAEKVYRELIDAGAGHEQFGTWRLRLSLVLYLQQQYEQAAAATEELLPDLEDSNSLAEAQFILGASRLHLGRFEDAVKALQASLLAHAEWRHGDKVLYELAQAHKSLGNVDEATAHFRTLAARHPTSPLAPEANFQVGERLFERREYAQAMRCFIRVIDRFAGDDAGADAGTWRVKAGFNAARCAEMQIQTAEDSQSRAKFISLARKYYSYVVEKDPSGELAAEAEQRRQVLQ